MKNKPLKSRAHIPSYFEHNSKATNWDVIEWPAPIEVKETTSETAIQRVRDEWLKSIKDSQQ